MMSPARAAFLASSSGISLLAVSSLLGQGPSLSTLSLASLGWGAFMTTGVFFPWLKMYGPVVCRCPERRAEVALTFDDGPHPETTPRVLEALAGSRHRATFFVLGDKARRYPGVVRAIHDAGHALGVHGDTHDRLHSFRGPWRVRDEILRARRAVEDAAGVSPRLFRPPIGHTTPATVHGARLAGVTLVGWSARGYDGFKHRSAEALLKRVSRSLAAGAVVLLHDAAERDDFEPASVRALPELLRILDARGLASVPVERWLAESARERERDFVRSSQRPSINPSQTGV